MPERFIRNLFILIFCFADILSFPQKLSTFQKYYGVKNSGNYASSELELPDKGFLITGVTYLKNGYTYKILVIRTDSVGRQMWSKTYSGSGNGTDYTGWVPAIYLQIGVDMVLTPDGNVVICSNTHNYTAAYLFKIDLNGTLFWSKKFPGGSFVSGATVGLSIANATDGGYVITGTINLDSAGGKVFVIKTDTGGNVIWSNEYYRDGFQGTGMRITPSRSGGYYVCGASLDTGSGNITYFGNYMILKIDLNGKLIWSKIYGSYTSAPTPQVVETANSILELPDQSIYVFGIGEAKRGADYGGSLMKLDSDGNLLWSKLYNSSSTSNISNVEFRSAVYDTIKKTLSISCEFETTGSTYEQCGIMRLDTSGKIIFAKTYPGALGYIFRASGHNLLQLQTGDFALLQSVFAGPSSDGWQYFFVKMDYSGNSNNCSTSLTSISSAAYPIIRLYEYTYDSIKLKTSSGCSVSSINVSDTLVCAPMTANFTWTHHCPGFQVLFHDSSYYLASHWRWNFGDPGSDTANTSTLQNPMHVYANPGTYTVTLVVGNIGVDDEIYKSVIIYKPSTPQIDYASVVSPGEIQIEFKKSIPEGIKVYELFKSVNGGSFSQIASITNQSNANVYYDYPDYNNIDPSANTYAYKVVAIDSCGVVSDTSNIHQSMLLNLKKSGCSNLQFSWTPYSGWAYVKKYEVLRSTNAGADSVVATLDGSTTTYTDNGLDYTNIYCYTIQAFDSGSNASLSNSVCGQAFAPDTPQIITVTKTKTSATNGTVVIRWKSINKPFLAYNELYYSSDGIHFNLANNHLPASIDTFAQQGLDTKDSDYYFYLVTVDSCAEKSAHSDTSKTMNLTLSVGKLLHKLNWTRYKGYKVIEYYIERLEKGAFVIIDSVPGTDTSSREFPAPCNYAIYYRIVAVGFDSGQLSWSDTAGRHAIDTTPPNAAKIISLRVLSANNIQLNFISSDSPDVYTYVVQRAINGTWGTASDFITHLHGAASIFIDTINTLSNQLCYTVITLDSCLNVALSDTICSESLSGKALYCKAQVLLNWKQASEPLTVPDSFIVLRSKDNVNYNKISESPNTDITDVDTNVTAGMRYYYKLEAVYKQANMISYSDSFSIIPKIIPEADSAQLVYATVLKSDEINGAVYIKWKRAMLNDTNARGYYLYSFNSTNGKYALLKDITDLNDTTFINSNINTIKDVNKYYVLTYNVCDVGINSNIHRTVLLNVQGKNLSEQLNWINYLGVPVKNYSIYKSVDGGSQNLVKNVGTDSSYLDSNISCNHNITYQIQAILSNGEISFSDSITVKSYDSIRPVTKPIKDATVIRTDVTDGRIKLSWNGATDNNLLGYNVYRSEDGFIWQLVVGGYPSTSLIDSGLDTYDASYYYKIQPIDSCGNTGPFTIYHKTINLKAKSGNGYNQINWNGYIGWPVRKYLLYRDGILIDTFANNQFAYKDSSIICHTIYQYLIKATDSVNDTIISASNTDSARVSNHIPPQKVYIKTVTVSKPNKAATITWTPSSSYDVKNYYIYRKSAVDGSMRLIDSTTSTSYSDSSETITEPDCYYVFARDHCGNQSDGSNQGCIITLTAKNQPGYNDVSWNSYQTWYDRIQSYNVYKNEDGTGWQLIGTTSSVQINQFKDSKLGDSTIDFCYQVEAIENPGQFNQLSRSTVECVHQDATVFIPNSFTPYNQDGLNDFFGPKGIYIKSYDMKIYNRWGEMVYTNSSPLERAGEATGWDGTFRGQPVQQGIYIYMITVTDYNGKQSYFKGTVTMFE